jgi:cytoskeletal protein RodZ
MKQGLTKVNHGVDHGATNQTVTNQAVTNQAVTNQAVAEKDTGVLGLANIRRNRGISLEQIAAATKIGVRALDAIERGDFSKLPGGIYNTSYIRQYARAIDYDESILLAYYASTMAGVEEDAQRSTSHGKGTYNGLRTVPSAGS